MVSGLAWSDGLRLGGRPGLALKHSENSLVNVIVELCRKFSEFIRDFQESFKCFPLIVTSHFRYTIDCSISCAKPWSPMTTIVNVITELSLCRKRLNFTWKWSKESDPPLSTPDSWKSSREGRDHCRWQFLECQFRRCPELLNNNELVIYRNYFSPYHSCVILFHKTVRSYHKQDMEMTIHSLCIRRLPSYSINISNTSFKWTMK